MNGFTRAVYKDEWGEIRQANGRRVPVNGVGSTGGLAEQQAEANANRDLLYAALNTATALTAAGYDAMKAIGALPELVIKLDCLAKSEGVLQEIEAIAATLRSKHSPATAPAQTETPQAAYVASLKADISHLQKRVVETVDAIATCAAQRDALGVALRKLSLAAQMTVATAGRDPALCEALDSAAAALRATGQDVAGLTAAERAPDAKG